MPNYYVRQSCRSYVPHNVCTLNPPRKEEKSVMKLGCGKKPNARMYSLLRKILVISSHVWCLHKVSILGENINEWDQSAA